MDNEKGLLNNDELINSLILDCNNAVKAIIGGNEIQWCKIMYEMVVKLSGLKNGIKEELRNKDKTIETLKQSIQSNETGEKE